MGSEYKSLFEKKDSRGFSITVEDLSITTVQQEVMDMLELAGPIISQDGQTQEVMGKYIVGS